MDEQKIYYGQCYLYIVKYIPKNKNEVKMYYLKVLSPNNKKQICEIIISPYVYNYLINDLADVPIEKKRMQQSIIFVSPGYWKRQSGHME